MKYPNLFSSIKIGKVSIKNRVVMPAMGTALCTMNGEMNSNTIAYYKERAKGGVGLIIVEVSEIDFSNGRSALCPVRMDNAHVVPELRRLTEDVHLYGAKVLAQLHHGGNQAYSFNNEGNEMVSASDVKSEAMPERPRPLSTAEVKAYIQKYIDAAYLAKLSQFDGVELHGAHGYLITQFLSPHTNRRTDEYGGSFENRCRFATEIIKGIRERCGDNFLIGIRLSLDEMTPHGYNLEEGCKIAKAMEDAGVEFIDASFATYETYPASVEPAGFDEGWRMYMTEAVKKVVNIPLITVGNIRNPDYCERAISQGNTDMVAMGRSLLADPDWCNKALAGKTEQIRRCVSCCTCIQNVLGHSFICCSLNPRCGYEAELPQPVHNGAGRKVVIVGGGPGGIEAARITALRGFTVVLMEKEDTLGGQLVFGMKPLNKWKIGWYIEYAANELERLGVEVRLNCIATPEMIKAEDPYAVFIATGGMAIVPKLPGIESTKVITAEQYLAGGIDLKDKTVAVVGGGNTGCETATLVASRGNKACVIEMLDDVCIDQYSDLRKEMMLNIEKYGVEIKTKTRLTEVVAEGINVKDLNTNENYCIPADYIILALGVRPVNDLYQVLYGEQENLFCIGDAQKQGKIINATRAGHVFALELE